ncbi:MAG TPA: glucose-6-phosphate isomerase [Chthoniobacterales bacterium]
MITQWQRFNRYYLRYPDLQFSLDVSRIHFEDDYFGKMAGPIAKAFKAMDELEKGAIANPDEKRLVGHYWLRSPQLAPTDELRHEVEDTNEAIFDFVRKVDRGEILAGNGQKFTDVLVVGIGGSALGPQFVREALGTKDDQRAIHYLDNTDPEGIDRVFEQIGSKITTLLTVVISKSGGTKETRNGMLEAAAKYQAAGLDFAKHFVAVTGEGSELDKKAQAQGWLARFPMFDWVGGRTSVMSAVGVVPMALQGINIEQFLAGAAAMDEKTRVQDYQVNASMLLALMWYRVGEGRGLKDMVILPYKDRLMLFSKYLQQLVMESLGKERDLDGQVVHQGIAVYGNKGSTDQHAYVQQLRDGVNNFFVTFIQVDQDRPAQSMEVDPGVTSGDYLHGFLRGTRSALFENDRQSITMSIDRVTPFSVGALIALYERAVGFYATLVNINAYHQPGVEAGKKAATKILELQASLVKALSAKPGQPFTADQLADAVQGNPEDAFHVLVHVASNNPNYSHQPGSNPQGDTFSYKG